MQQTSRPVFTSVFISKKLWEPQSQPDHQQIHDGQVITLTPLYNWIQGMLIRPRIATKSTLLCSSSRQWPAMPTTSTAVSIWTASSFWCEDSIWAKRRLLPYRLALPYAVMPSRGLGLKVLDPLPIANKATGGLGQRRILSSLFAYMPRECHFRKSRYVHLWHKLSFTKSYSRFLNWINIVT